MTDENETVRRNLFSVEPADAHGYGEKLKASELFEFKSYLSVSENCHLERYRFTHSGGKLVIVYDTKAFMLSFSGKPAVLTDALNVCGLPKFDIRAGSDAEIGADFHVAKSDGNQPKQSDNKIGGNQPKQSDNKSGGNQPKQSDNKSGGNQPKQSDNKSGGNQPKQSDNKSGGNQPKQSDNKSGGNQLKHVKAQKGNNAEEGAGEGDAAQDKPEYKNGYAVKNCPQSRIDGFIKRIKALKGVTVTVDGAQNGDVVSYVVQDKKRQHKCLLRYTPKSKSAQLQGKRSSLFGEVQVILSSGSDFSEAMGSHIKLTGEPKRAVTVQKDLRKLLPDAFDLLGEPSKIDIGIGMIDIGNDDVRLSDYSVLLVPPYRGLERFIFDLQQARGISVKMIGQAYEKDDDGNYMLKAGYRKKNGVVYSEVMSALYTEYFAQRNFYAHSDNTDMNVTRVLPDKEAARKIFGHLCEVINYNAKKLKEIGFTIPRADKYFAGMVLK